MYDELRRIAGRELRRERPNQTLAPTTLVHELSPRTIKREWRLARAWLHRELRGRE